MKHIKSKVTNKRLALILLLLLLLVPILYFNYFNSTKIPEDYSKVEGYVHVEPGSITCGAFAPECGYCAGEVIDKSCYIKSGTNVFAP